MAFVKRFALAMMVLALAAPVALAGPNAGGVLVVHATTQLYSSDVSTYMDLSGVGCGLDGPAFPQTQECPPYDPLSGPNPCNPRAADPTSSIAADTPHVWYVMAAFDESTCPRLKALSFRIDYDATKMLLLGEGRDLTAFALTFPSDNDGAAFPAPGSGVALSYSKAKTSQLQEIYWFAGYAYSGQTDVTFALREKSPADAIFVDDATPGVPDPIAGFGTLGLGGTVGNNPAPLVSPTETSTWGRIKQTYR